MRKAKVLVSDLGARGNKIFHSGDTVVESNFPEGNFDRLINGKYIEEIFEKATEEIASVEVDEINEVESNNSTEEIEETFEKDETESHNGFRKKKKK